MAVAGHRLAPGWLRSAGSHRAGLCRRAEAALAAVETGGKPGRAGGLPGALHRAACLADAGLFFEVHELLEPVWLAARGRARTVLQGLIQVAAGLHHAEHGNRAGAVRLLRRGLGHLRGAPDALGLETGPWATTLEAACEALEASRPGPRLGPWPRPPAGGS